MWITNGSGCCMEHMMLGDLFETSFKAWENNLGFLVKAELQAAIPSWTLDTGWSWTEPQDSSESLKFTPIAAANEVDWKHDPILPHLYKLPFLFIYPKPPFEISGQIHCRPEATGSFSTSSFFNKLLSKPHLCFKAGYNIPEPWGFAELWVSKWKPNAGSLFHNPCSSLT